jgi:hypothetical protein
MRFNDGATDPKAHASPVPLGGKERIEYLICLLRGQSDAGITHRQHKLLVLRPL